MLRALGPSLEDREDVADSLAAQLEAAQARVKQLETEKRRAERLLLLTRKLVRPGGLTMGRGGRPRKYARRSTKAGRASSPIGPTKTPVGGASIPATTSEVQP